MKRVMFILFALVLVLPANAATVILRWAEAVDCPIVPTETVQCSPPSMLVYELRQSALPNIDTLENALQNGTVIMPYAAASLQSTVFNLVPGTTVFFNVIVKDQNGNRAAYKMTSVTPILADTLDVTFTAPTLGSTVRAKYSIVLAARDETGIVRLELSINDVLMAWYPGGGLTLVTGSETGGTFTYLWQTGPYKNRTAKLSARAIDADGHIATATIPISVIK